MYFPKSQITPNLHTKGNELAYLDSRLNYKGYYFRTSKGLYFSGKNPNSKPNIELILDIQLPQNVSIQVLEDNQANWVIRDIGYLSSTQININNVKTFPKYFFPSPTPEDYEIGEFYRFFLRKNNEIKFIEISEEEHLKYENQDETVQYELYTPIQISWDLTGDKDLVYKVNQKASIRYENIKSVSGFTQYFKNRFTQFYKEN